MHTNLIIDKGLLEEKSFFLCGPIHHWSHPETITHHICRLHLLLLLLWKFGLVGNTSQNNYQIQLHGIGIVDV